MKKQLRTIQPAHVSEKFTVQEAQAAWRKVEAEFAAREKARSARRGKSTKRVVKEDPSAPRATVAAGQAK